MVEGSTLESEPLESFSQPLKTAAEPMTASWCSHGRRRTVRLDYPRRPFFYGRGIVVVQQSPKLPYESSILSVRAIFT